MLRRMTVFGAVAAVTAAVAWLGAADAGAQEIQISYKVCGFSADAKQMLVAIDDANAPGPVLRVWEVDPPAVVKKVQPIAFARADGPKTIRETRKKLKFVDAGVDDLLYPLDPKDETKTLSFFGLMAAKGRFVLAVTDKQRLGKIKDIEIKKDEETKTLAKASLRQLFWTTDRKVMVAVITQRIDTGSFTSERDEFHVVRFKLGDIQWVDSAPEPGK